MGLSYRFKKNGSIVLSSIRGLPLKDFKRLNDDQLSQFGLYKETDSCCRHHYYETLEHFKLRYESAFSQ